MGLAGIREAYETGRGRVVMRAKVHTEDVRGGKTALIVTEMPYMVKKGGDDGVITEDRRAGRVEGADRDLGLNDESRPHRHAHLHRAQARRHPEWSC